MTIANGCLLAACILPIACTGIAKGGRFSVRRRDGGYDNHDPRAWLARQTGWRARANAAQANSFEALPLFIAAVLAAQQADAPQRWIDLLALSFVGLRVAYIGLYLADLPSLRSLVWFGGWLAAAAIFFTPLMGA